MIELLKLNQPHNSVEGVLGCGEALLGVLDPKYAYHCPAHSIAVKGFVDDYIKWNASDKRPLHEPRLKEWEWTSLRIAAMFHDLGFLDSPVHNEGIGTAYAMAAMANLSETHGDFADTIKNEVAKYILTTARLNVPVDRRQAIILDADMVHVGAPDPAEFLMWNKRLRDEYEALGRIYGNKEWLDAQVAFLSKVKFRTAYAKEIGMDKNLKANIKALKKHLGADLHIGIARERNRIAGIK